MNIVTWSLAQVKSVFFDSVVILHCMMNFDTWSKLQSEMSQMHFSNRIPRCYEFNDHTRKTAFFKECSPSKFYKFDVRTTPRHVK